MSLSSILLKFLLSFLRHSKQLWELGLKFKS